LSFFKELKRRNVFRVAIAYIVMAWLVMQVTDVVLNNIEAPDWVFQTILLLLGIGFIVAMFFSWAFEMTPEGLKREHEVDRAQSITPQTGKKLNNLIFAVMGLALVYFAFDKFVLTSSRDAALVEATTQAMTDQATVEDDSEGTDTSIAVLPFVNMSSDPEQEYFSDGISEEILNVLAQLPNLHVTSRSSAFQFKGDDIDIPSVAAQLGVEHVLEGSVRKSGNQVRITAQLIEAGQDRHLWSETYDRQLNDVFAVQDEISVAIVEALKATLGIEMIAPRAAQRPVDPRAHNEYLLGVYQMELRGAEPLERAIAHFKKALEFDPDYVPALARLSMTLNLYPQYSAGHTRQEFIDQAAPYAEHAYTLDPNSWEANLAKGSDHWQRAVVNGTTRMPAIEFFQRAVELNPSYGTSYAWLASAKQEEGDLDGALRIREAAIEIAPLDRILLDNLTGAYIRRNRYEDARKIIQRMMTVAPAMAYSRSAHLATSEGRWADNAIALLQRLALAPQGSNYWARRIVADDLGLPEEALTIGGLDSYCGLYFYMDRADDFRSCFKEYLDRVTGVEREYSKGLLAFHTGDVETAVLILDQEWASFQQRDRYTPSPEHIYARWDAGDREGAMELVQHLENVVATRREAGQDTATQPRDLGMAYFIVGDKAQALPLLTETVERGLFIRSMFSYLKTFREDPDIARLLERQAAKTVMEREHFLNIMCGSDNPIADYWHPSDVACALADREPSS
jgi:TolB-like protein